MKKRILAISILVLCVLSLCLGLTACASEYALPLSNELQANILDDNYRTFYEIFVGGFSDSDGDGMGDLQGVIKRLDYLNDGDPNSGKSLGINGIWLMPIMPSFSYHKYDVADYQAIDDDYGTMDDMRQLVREAHARGINVIIDLVLNHTSTAHKWFKAAQKARRDGNTADPYYDFYSVSTEQKANWYSFATDPSGTKWYYEGNFSSEMPELNWDNPAVKQAVEDIVDFWLTDVGVDGFRLDAVRYFYYGNTAKNIEVLDWFRKYCQSVLPDVYVVGEDWGGGTAEEYSYFQAVDVFCFNMGATVIESLQAQDANNYADFVCQYAQNVREAREDAIPQPFLSNHDQDRIGGNSYFYVRKDGKTVFNTAAAKMAANMYLLSSGSPFIYYGEEIGMKGSRSISDNSDANRRLAMLWGDNDKVKDPVGTTFDRDSQTNGTVKSQLKDKNSLLNHYKLLIAIRNANPEIARGIAQTVHVSDLSTVCAIKYTYDNRTVYVIHNIGNQQIQLDLSQLGVSALRAVAGEGGGALSGATLTLGAKTSAVLR